MDEPVQLTDHSSNILNAVADDRAVNADKTGFKSDGTVWAVVQFCIVILNTWYFVQELVC